MSERLSHTIEVETKQRFDVFGMVGEVLQCFLHRVDKHIELRKVTVMGGAALNRAPQELNWVVVRRVAGQISNPETISVFLEICARMPFKKAL